MTVGDTNRPVNIEIRVAKAAEASIVQAILAEAVSWLDESGRPMWWMDEIRPDVIFPDVSAGLFALAWSGPEAVGTVKFQLEDPVYWPDLAAGTSAFVHRLAVQRRFAGGDVSSALLSWALREALRHGRNTLRLDCDADRPKLRQVYERFGFRYHSDRRVGPYLVARYEYPLASGDRL